jgi:protein-ribulosamine 3-kinase
VSDWPAIAFAISQATGRRFEFAAHVPTSGGYINQTLRIEGKDGRNFFLKLNEVAKYPILLSEVMGLAAIAATRTLRVPCIIIHGTTDLHSYLVLEYLELQSHGDAGKLGEQLATMHRHTSAQFGFEQDNHIGATVQPNAWMDDWIAFFRERRLGFQLQLARERIRSGKLLALGERLMESLPGFFADHKPAPSLLHGDLWGGNHAYLADGAPVTFDPAAYYGDRECDLAMTELFGGFAADFYAAYRASFPLNAGYAARKDLYNLYHILNHANMFGGSYVRQSEQMMQRLLTKAA